MEHKILSIVPDSLLVSLYVEGTSTTTGVFMSSSALLSPLTVGALKLKNRVIMAPLTRCRATGLDGRTPNELMKKYYVQRATAGMIITEATSVTPMGVGYANTPGIWSEEQVAGWKMITDAVHDEGGKILLQLWHVGRISHPHFLNGELPVSASAIEPEGYVSILRPKTPFITPRALAIEEIAVVIEAYRKAAQNAKRAGFDGVEIHGANGYLLDQFLQDGSNKLSDQYGGPIENRARLILEVTDAVISVWGSDRVGVHLAPRGDSHSMRDSNREVTFSYVVEQLSKRKIAFICTREYVAEDSLMPKLRKIFKGVFIGNEKFTITSGEAAVSNGEVDAIAYGKDFISNPDLVKRIETKSKLNKLVTETIYAEGPNGYTDYPSLGNLI
jgi:2,4-dienoyl-CoA reductase-like NADH-dependent reductase (Old Yellow Enzyme family)